MKQLILLLRHYSFLPLPQKRPLSVAELPAALWLLPLWGLLAGLLSYGVAWLLWVVDFYWGAALLLGVNVLLNGGVWLRDIMLLAEGRRPLTVTEQVKPAYADQPPHITPVIFGSRALLAGGLYLSLHYLCLLALLRMPLQPYALVAVAVCCRFIYVWGVYDFAARYPAFLHQGMEKRGFARASLTALLAIGVCAAMDSGLWLPLLAALLLAWLFFRMRVKYLGALDEPTYGGAAATTEILFYLIYVFFS